MGILDGKRILVAGVTMDSSIGFATAKVAQEQGATVLISNFGRALGITRRIAKRLPVEPPVLELDVTDPEHLERLPELVREHVDGLDGVVHSIAYGNPETLLGGKFLTGPWEDVAQAVHVSAYSLKSLATGGQAADGARAPRSSASPSTRPSPGRRTTGWAWPRPALESTSRYLARDLGADGIRVQPGLRRAAEDPGRQGDPGVLRPRGDVGDPRPARLGQHRPRADRQGRVRAALGLLPGHHRRDRARRRRVPRDGRLSAAPPGRVPRWEA